MGKRKYAGTPYDDVFRSLVVDHKQLLLAFINEMFSNLGERYQGDEEVINLSEIVYINRQDGEQDKRIVDSAIAVISHDGTRRVFHLECQSSDDNSMMIRMIEYDTQIAIRHNREQGDGNIRIRMPESGVLYLRSTDKTPDKMGVTIEAPGNRSVSYEMPVVKLKNYDVDSIFEKELYLLIPFYLFNLEDLFDQITDGDKQAKAELRGQITDLYERLKERTDEGQIDEYTKASIINLSKKVMNALTRSYGAVRKEVDHIMGGKVLEYEAKTIRRKALAEGEAKGKAEGITEAERNMVEKLCRKGVSVDDAADLTSALTRDEVQAIFDSILEK